MAAPADTFTQDQITYEKTKVPGKGIEMDAHFARPKSDGPHPAVIVVHENKGIDANDDTAGPHYQDLVQRLARQGFVAVAAEYYQRGGGPQENPPAQVQGDVRSLFDWLRSQPYVRANGIGITGFCWGGGITYDTAVNIPELGAAVPFYGRNPEPIESVANVHAPVLAFYGGEDARVNAGIPAMEEAMKKNGKKWDHKVFPGAPHAFFNERKTNYHEASAGEAWEKMLAFFNENLRK
ncbi:MAG TPA: dienelactone hydrolase family protein [Chloroflexota bacterium]